MIPIAQPDIRETERQFVQAVLEDGQLADGPEVRAFENGFSETVGTRHAVATSNGTTALHAALVALDIGPGDRVLTSPFSFIASANAARLAGAEVGFVDIEPETLTLDPDALETVLERGEQVDAVIAVHLYGLPAAMDRLVELRDRFGFALVEDAAQAHAATFKGRPVGGLGDVGCFSFYPTKNMTTGEGGMITTDDASLAERARRFIDHGRSDQYIHADVGHNFRMSSIHAAIGRAQLRRLGAYTAARRQHAQHLTDALAGTPVRTPADPRDRSHVYHQYTIRHPDRDWLQRRLADAGVQSAVYYPVPIHRQAPYTSLGVTAPVAERAADEVLSIPVHPRLSPEDLDRITETLTQAVEVVA